jgi:hypothetical protein
MHFCSNLTLKVTANMIFNYFKADPTQNRKDDLGKSKGRLGEIERTI